LVDEIFPTDQRQTLITTTLNIDDVIATNAFQRRRRQR
jgi:hypothetical protein